MKEIKEKLEALTRMVEQIAKPIPAIPAIPPILPIPSIPAIPAIYPSGDHDTIVKLVEGVANLDSKFSEKFSDVRNDIQKLGDGTTLKLNDLEIRQRVIEKFVDNWKGKNAIFAVILMFIIGLIGSWVSNLL